MQLAAKIRDARTALAQYRTVRRANRQLSDELAAFSTAAERAELDLMLDRHSDEETRQIRAILSRQDADPPSPAGPAPTPTTRRGGWPRRFFAFPAVRLSLCVCCIRMEFVDAHHARRFGTTGRVLDSPGLPHGSTDEYRGRRRHLECRHLPAVSRSRA